MLYDLVEANRQRELRGKVPLLNVEADAVLARYQTDHGGPKRDGALFMRVLVEYVSKDDKPLSNKQST